MPTVPALTMRAWKIEMIKIIEIIIHEKITYECTYSQNASIQRLKMIRFRPERISLKDKTGSFASILYWNEKIYWYTINEIIQAYLTVVIVKKFR